MGIIGSVDANYVPMKCEINVLPKNSERLKMLCKSFSEVALETELTLPDEWEKFSISNNMVKGNTKQERAALALSFITDNIALPYLNKVFNEGKIVAEVAIRGFKRINTPEATQILIDKLIANEDYHVVDYARPEISELYRTTKNPTIKSMLEEVKPIWKWSK